MLRKTKEKCPDGSDIPANGDCTKKDVSGNIIPQPAAVPDKSGCSQPSSYITNHFPLVIGMQGDFVKALQHAMNIQFNARLSEDGFLGCNTMEAMQNGFGIASMDAQQYKDKILTPQMNPTASAYTQVPPIDSTGCDINGLDVNGFPCSTLG